ncbi:MAG: tRNA (N6-isopentenyl adenosine(37)-C2)-methylthiotransferase MiaB [Candidatus Omnitrophica bacterium]|nr:tRNA (N6-isopentenyl adenosine(37)-C2)-methylthiotransferase MiaB [Candidatus Omnitrophota bacterium]
MNSYDSQLAAGLLEREGFEVVMEGEASEMCVTADGRPKLSQGADIVLMNTCSVREHAEERVWGRLGMLGKEKEENPALIVGLMGCMVEEHRETLFKRFPRLDFMVGTRNIKELAWIIREVQKTRAQTARIKQEGLSIEYCENTRHETNGHAWLPIMTGCDKICTFCIVPKTRGREVSMPAREVLCEAERLAAKGIKWVTLLGQNVNSYNGTRDSGLGTGSFPELLEMLCRIQGLERISFTTSHPQDATEELFQVIARNPKISRRFHLPLQSGSDTILRRMKRLHTFAEYRAKVERLRALVTDVAITTDLIVGFPTESAEDHEATVRALREIRFDGAFIYKYSARPGTPAARLRDDVSDAEKAARLQELLGLQKKIRDARGRDLVGKVFTAYVESARDDRPREQIGRTDHDRRVAFEAEKDLRGRFVCLEITGLRHETFQGKLVSSEAGRAGLS